MANRKPSDPCASESNIRRIVHISLKSAVNTTQSLVRRVGNALIGGDFSGQGRGQDAIDITVTRSLADRVASGRQAVAIGNENSSRGIQSVAMGYGNSADGLNAVAIGSGAGADTDYAVSVGSGSNAGATRATAIGPGADAETASSLAIGDSATITAGADVNAIAIGKGAISHGPNVAVIAAVALYLQTAGPIYTPVLTTASSFDVVLTDNNGDVLADNNGDVLTE